MALGDPYVSASELAEYLRMDPPAESAGDDLMSLSVLSASESINDYCRREFNLATTATARYFDITREGELWVDDIGHATFSVATDTAQDGTWSTAWATSDVQGLPLDALAAFEPIERLLPVGDYTFPRVTRRTGLIRVTARWGWPAVPPVVKQATFIHAAQLFKRFESPTGVLGGGDFGIVRIGSRLDPHLEQLLTPKRRLMVG